jgi:hypothetical protein
MAWPAPWHEDAWLLTIIVLGEPAFVHLRIIALIL